MFKEFCYSVYYLIRAIMTVCGKCNGSGLLKQYKEGDHCYTIVRCDWCNGKGHLGEWE